MHVCVLGLREDVYMNRGPGEIKDGVASCNRKEANRENWRERKMCIRARNMHTYAIVAFTYIYINREEV